MGHKYEAVSWNPQKKKYDIILWSGISLLMTSIVLAHFVFHPDATIETVIIRTTSLTAFFLLHVVLMIGPLSRVNSIFLPLLYNRRHLGVSLFIIAAIHGVFAIIQFHSLGDINPIASIFLSNTKYLSISAFPFQVFGFLALVILFLMAATSHDFWLNQLSPGLWKWLHMMVYLAYGLLILHVALGILQYENKLIYWVMLFAGFASIASLHLWAGWKALRDLKKTSRFVKDNGFYNVGPLTSIGNDCAKGIFIDNQNIAIFKYDGKVSAVSNVCRHQMGPLSEGRIIDGCITCPWHGYQYQPQDGQSPPPFTEKLETYDVRIVNGDVWINPVPHPEGTYVKPASI